MADSSAAKTHKRLSVWSATEPLPVPLPPPPRTQVANASVSTLPQLHPAHQLPPDPHWLGHGTNPDPLAAVSPTPQPAPRRSSKLTLSVAIAAMLVGGIGWFQMREPRALDWPTLKSIVLTQIIEPAVPEPELPYVTVMPLVPNSSRNNVVEREQKTVKRAKQVTMSNIKLADPTDADPATETQRR